jgi:ABC-type polysaccharide/polyol phosphate export permease
MEDNKVVPQRSMKSPGFAGVLGMFPFGVGALYNGQYTKALLHLVIFSGLVHMQGRGGGQPFIGLVLAGFIVYQFFDNIQSAKAINAAAAGQAVAVDQALPEILILANFEIINYDTLFDFWPVAVIVLGFKLVVDAMAKSRNGK